MWFDILTLFPEAFSYLNSSILKHAQKNRRLRIRIHDLRSFALDRRKTVDGRPYGGGAGMVLRVDIMARALSKLKGKSLEPKINKKVILLTPQGQVFSQRLAEKLSKYDRLVLVCGHYEGFDERIRKMVDMEVSVGDYVLTGGELPAMVVVDAVARLQPGVLGKSESSKHESFSIFIRKNASLLEYPQYSRPEKFSPDGKKVWKVPRVLLSGHHGKISDWRLKEAFKRTKKRRPDLLVKS